METPKLTEAECDRIWNERGGALRAYVDSIAHLSRAERFKLVREWLVDHPLPLGHRFRLTTPRLPELNSFLEEP